MNNRIKTIIKYIDSYDKVIDIGCDHALLSIELAKINIPSIASDIRKHILDKYSKRIIDLKLENLIDLRVGDGLEVLNEKEADTVVLSGIGTHTILNIISKSTFKFKKIITVSSNNHKILREKMLLLGYKIKEEEIIFDKEKIYNLIIFESGHSNYTEEELYVGVNHQNKNNLKKYHDFLINEYKDINTDKMKKLINIIKNYKY